MSTDLRLNSLDQFRKQSSRLVLEEHGSCEVPAGCGGVVLRWVDPDEGQPIVIRLVVAGEAEVYLDGGLIEGDRTIAAWGEHVLAVHLQKLQPPRILMVATTRDDPSGSLSEDPELRIVAACTSTNGTWRLSSKSPPGPEWTLPLFDDSRWAAWTIGANLDNCSKETRWRYDRFARSGAAPLQLPTDAEMTECWLRVRFAVQRQSRP